MIRAQGDILCIKVTSEKNEENRIVLEKTEDGRHILVFGEKTNHAHVIDGEEGVDFKVHTCPTVEAREQGVSAWRIDVLSDKVTMSHVDVKTGKPSKNHGSVDLEKGSWAVRTQREFGPDAEPQRVID